MARVQIQRQAAKNDGPIISRRGNKPSVSSTKRVTKRASVQSGGQASRRQRKTLTPYTPQEYSRDACVWFSTAQSWESEQSKLVEGIKMVRFFDGFDITDAHLTSIISKDPGFCHSLLDFRAGDAETGNGARMSDALIIRLAEACPNIVHISLDGAKNLTDESFIAIVMNCSNLRYIQFSGNDRNTGKLTKTALDTLRGRPEIGKHLVKLRLTDQVRFDKQFDAAVRALSAARKSLAIEVGCTSERDGDVNTWLDGKIKYGYQAFGGPGGFDSYGGFGGW